MDVNTLCCPHCKHRFDTTRSKTTLECQTCGETFGKTGGVWDLRAALTDARTGWQAQRFESSYRALGKFLDGYAHAQRSNIPVFVEDYRLARLKDRISKRIMATPEATLLDLGCGNGWFALRLRRHWRFTGPITGVDISPFQTRTFLDEADETRVSDITAHCANAEKLPFADGQFDIVVMTEVIEHTFSPEAAIQESARVLRSGGTLIITTPSGPMCAFWKRFFRPFQIVKRVFSPSQTDPALQIYDSPMAWARIDKARRSAGLDLVDFQKSIYLPHESYIQFFPQTILWSIVFLARALERCEPMTQWMALHYIAELKKA